MLNTVPIQLVNTLSWSDHRSGWAYVLSLLKNFERSEGLWIDGCVDSTFGYQANENVRSGTIPYQKEWIGFLHHPVTVCPWYNQPNLAPDYVLRSEPFRASLPYCQGLLTFSEHLAAHVRQKVSGIPVRTLTHPTEDKVGTFSFGRFRAAPKVVQVGCWMRELVPFFRLAAPAYKKYLLTNAITLEYLRRELAWSSPLSDEQMDSVAILRHLNNETYDTLLSESVVFMKLFDSSANNAVIECIVRNTPLLVNPLPSVVEYLGREYPLYYGSLPEAESMLRDYGRIKAAYHYLRQLDKARFGGEYFLAGLFDFIQEVQQKVA